VLFENSIVCLVVLFFCCCFLAMPFAFPVCGVWLFFDASFLVSFCQVSLIVNSPTVCGGFCLESLILAQDERWRRA
jgi:hypothetical protein